MGSPSQSPLRYRFGPFHLVPGEGTLSRAGTRVKLQDLPFRLLTMLVERAGEIVTREDLRQRLWPENTYVEFDNSLGVAVRKIRESLGDVAEAPHYVETLPRRGYRFVAPVSVAGAGVAEEIKAAAVDHVETITVPDRPLRGRYLLIAALASLMVTAAIYEFRPKTRDAANTTQPGVSSGPVRVRRSVAVLGFRNLPGRAEDNWLSAAFSEMLNTELAAGGELRLVSGEDVARAKKELPLNDEDSLAPPTLQRLRSDPGADVVVLGSYTSLSSKDGNQIRLDLRVQDTSSGETISEESVSGSQADLFQLVSQASARLRQSLGVSDVSSMSTARAALPSNEKAARLYAEGRAKLWAYDFVGARDLLAKAIAADPNYPLAHSALSDVLWHSGYEVKARAESQRAVELSTQLSQEQRLLVEGQYRRSINDWPKAVEAYRSLFRLFPDSLDYGLLLASAQMNLKPSDSQQTLEALRRLPPPISDDARIDMVEASAWIGSDVNKARAYAMRAIAKGTAQGSHVIVARTYGTLCQQSVLIDTSTSDCENALQTAIAAKDRNGEAMMRNNLAEIYFEKGDLAHAGEGFRQAIGEFREVGNLDDSAGALGNLAAIRLSEGELTEAKKLVEESIVEYQASDDKEGIALSLDNLGELSRQSGNLGIAETTYQQAKATAQEIDDKDAIAYVLNGLGDVYMDRGDLGLARKSYEESMALRNQIGEKQLAAETQTALAQLSIEEGRAADSEIMARKYKQQFNEYHQADDELIASTALIKALLAQNKLVDAQKEIEATRTLAAKCQNRLMRLQFSLASARVSLASNHPDISRPLLERVGRDARAHGFVGLELENRLALAELAKTVGGASTAREQLVALEITARAKGFNLIAGKAVLARRGSER